ncbi:MAG: hypothetical protein QOE72_4769 [Chloroflexota bacterium]|jgi:hypothetical protein|nr:hypothetical protein [Chloroflexota bacterium]
MHPMLSLTCRMAAAAAGALSVGVPLAGPTITARAADGTVDPAPARDTTTVTTTCTYGVIIVFATPFTANLLPCSQPLSAGRTAASTPAGSTSVGGMH